MEGSVIEVEAVEAPEYIASVVNFYIIKLISITTNLSKDFLKEVMIIQGLATPKNPVRDCTVFIKTVRL